MTRDAGEGVVVGGGKGGLHVPGAGTLGMAMLLVSLGMLFAASVVGYVVIRQQNQPWPPPGFPALPRSLWISTVVILLSSMTIQRALLAARRGRATLRRDLLATLVLGVSFLALQVVAWWQIQMQIAPEHVEGSYLKLFYVLTGLHAAHVIGGLIPLAVVAAKAGRGAYSPNYHPGVRYVAMYWHFLDAVWVVLFVVMYLV